jgi:hypothetical protein
MPTFDEAKLILKNAHVAQGFNLVVDDGKALYFSIGSSTTPRLAVDEDEITKHQSYADDLTDLHISPVETSIVGSDFREQLVGFVGAPRHVPFSTRRGIKFVSSDAEAVIDLGVPSPIFSHYFRLQKYKVPFLTNRVERLYTDKPVTMSEVFSGLLTVKLSVKDTLEQSRDEQITSAFQTCLFELSYLQNITLRLLTEWPVPDQPRGPIRKRLMSSQLQLKPVKYDTTAVHFYQRGISTDDAYIQFISFYHVLELYFVRVSDQLLYNRLSRLFVDPSFRPTARHFDKVISSVEDHKRTNDETEMLKNVLITYIEEQDLIQFITQHETGRKINIYTERSKCFDEELDKLQLKEGHVLGPIAKRIKTIRNTLVHSSDRYERKQRYVPGPEADRVLLREIPLLRYIAEKVIIATAQGV